MNCADEFFKFLCKWVLENCPEDMKFVTERIDKNRVDRLQSVISSSFERISYAEALNVLNKVDCRTWSLSVIRIITFIYCALT